MIDKESKQLDILLDQYKECTDSITRDVGFVTQGMAFWTGAATLFFTLGWKPDTKILLLFTPFVFFYLIFHSIFRGKMVQFRSAQAAVLSEKINAAIDKTIVVYESDLTEKHAEADMPANGIALIGSICVVATSLVHYIMITSTFWLKVIAGVELGTSIILFCVACNLFLLLSREPKARLKKKIVEYMERPAG